MASIKKRRDGRYRARYRDPSGKERAKHFGRKADAERFLATVQADVLRGEWVDPASGRRTFGEYAGEWRAAQVWRPTTEAQVDSHLRNHILPALGDRPIGSVRPSEVQGLVKALTDRLAPSTVEVIYRHVAAIFRSAVDDRPIVRTPCVGVTLPRKGRREVDPLTPDQIEALVDAVPDRYAALVLTAAGTGLRQGEAFGLTVPAVDFLRRKVAVDRQLVLVDGAPRLAQPKTEASYRTVPLPDVVLEALSTHLSEWGEGVDRLVFTNDRGEPIRRNRFSEVWRPAVRRAGLPEGTRFHDLRHFYASLLIRHGESVKVVQSRLGHATASETLDTYSHLWPDSEDSTRAAVDAVFGRSADYLRTAGGS